MKYAYYPGCSLHSTAAEYDESFKTVCSILGVELAEIPDWVCCGTSPAHSSSHLLSLALPIKNLALAESDGQSEVVVPCASCFSRLKTALYETGQDQKLAEEINEIIESDFKRGVKVIHPLEIFSNLNPEIIRKSISKSYPQMKVVCYYGCLLTRPPKVMQFDICEYPMTMDRLLEDTGFSVLDWSYKTNCCGGSLTLSKTDTVLELCNSIMEDAKAVGADAIAVACPLCHANLDTRQEEVEAKYGTRHGLPILYFTQLMGLAFGVHPEELGIDKHFVSADNLLSGACKE